MKILREGRLPDQTLVGTCGHCQCQVECDRSEITDDESGWRIRCPTPKCGRLICLKAKGDQSAETLVRAGGFKR